MTLATLASAGGAELDVVPHPSPLNFFRRDLGIPDYEQAPDLPRDCPLVLFRRLPATMELSLTPWETKSLPDQLSPETLPMKVLSVLLLLVTAPSHSLQRTGSFNLSSDSVGTIMRVFPRGGRRD